MSHVELSNDGTPRTATPPPDDFPDLLAARLGRGQPARFDPARNRFANAVKKAAPQPLNLGRLPAPAVRHQFSPSIAPVPRPSPRIKLRPPTLLPTLRTGATVNSMYMSTRQNAIRLGQARNACLARAADAFRRGDGAAAKRFSREGKALNEKMVNEAAEAAHALVRERRKEAQDAVRQRDPAWSDDPTDRTERGKECAAGLGVVMGVASTRAVGVGGGELSASERTEVLLDLHTLHGQEAAEVLEEFLMAVGRLRVDWTLADGFDSLRRKTSMDSVCCNRLYRALLTTAAYIIVGEEKHVGTQDAGRGASRIRLAASIKEFLARWGYPWSEGGGVLCVDAATHY